MRSLVGAALIVLLGACGGSESSEPLVAATAPPVPPSVPASSTVAATDAPSSPERLPACDDVPAVEAPASWYRERPVYVGNEQPVEEVRGWALGQPGFQDLWLDREHAGWITLAFTGDPVARQAALTAAFPDVGVVAVEVPTTFGELQALQQRADRLLSTAGIAFAGSGIYVDRWVVGVDVNVADERVATALSPLVGQRVCLSDTGVPIPEGPQVDRGDGWRLLGDELVGESYRTGIATTSEQYTELWDRVGMTGQRPAVDFETEIVVWFGAVYGSSCPIRLDDVIVEPGHDPPLVHPVTVVPGGTGVCTSDANPHAYVVAIERSRLPAGSFALQLGPNEPPVGVPEERTIVDADLTAPAATADGGQIHPDQTLIERAGRPRPVSSGAVIEAGLPWPYRVDVRCGIGVLGEVNGIWWITGNGIVPVPPAWSALIDPSSNTMVVELILTTGPDPTATATANGTSVTYSPSSTGAVPSCDE